MKLGDKAGGFIGLSIALIVLCISLYNIVKTLHKQVMYNRGKGKVLGRRTNLTNKVRNQIVHMKSKQIGLKKIAKECKVSVKTIRKVLDETPLIRQVA